MTDVAACPCCVRTLRVKAPPAESCVLSHCPSCGAPVVVVCGESLLILDLRKATSWRVRDILRNQGAELGGAAGSALGVGALTALALGATGQIAAAAIAVVVAAVGGAGMAGSIAFDARTAASIWRRHLAERDDLLVVQPDGYRA